jgi:hypothetical protein
LLGGKGLPVSTAGPAEDEVDKFGILLIQPNFFAQKTRMSAKGRSPNLLVLLKKGCYPTGRNPEAEMFNSDRAGRAGMG